MRDPKPYQLTRPMMQLYPDERTATLIDGQNLYAAQKSIGRDTDFASLLVYLRARCRMITARYYTSYPDDKEFVTIRPLLDWLAFNGYIVSAKPRRLLYPVRADQRQKGNSLVDLVVDALTISDRMDHFVLFSGDEALVPLVAALQADRKRVTVVSTMRQDLPVCAPDLAELADEFVELEDFLREVAEATPKSRRKSIR